MTKMSLIVVLVMLSACGDGCTGGTLRRDVPNAVRAHVEDDDSGFGIGIGTGRPTMQLTPGLGLDLGGDGIVPSWGL